MAPDANLAAMPTDPTGMQQALETIPSGQLSERQTRIAAGISLVRDAGFSINRAAKECDIPYKTMWRHVKGLVNSATEQGFQADETALIAGSFDVALIANDKIIERLSDDDNPMRDSDLIKSYGVATDKIAAKRQWSRGTQSSDINTRDALTEALESVMRGGSVTVTGPDPISEAVEVEAISGDVD